MSPVADSHAARAFLQLRPHLGSVVSASDIDRVILILGSSRGGTSLLFHLLRLTGKFLCLDGEHVHLYKLNGMGLPAWAAAHDGEIDWRSADPAGFVRDLLNDCSMPDVSHLETGDQYAARVVARFVTQWPTLPIPVASAVEYGCQLAAHHRYGCPGFDPVAFHLDLIAWARKQGLDVNAWYYDIRPGRIVSQFPGLKHPSGPPAQAPDIVEEPPFVVTSPVTPADVADIERPLLLKASVDAYRADLLPRIFPSAQFKIIHLVRNPAAAINGLYDGWLHRGFFSHNLSGRANLDIAGYSDAPWARWWWKFDLPPGWDQIVAKPLPQVAAFQWRSAHRNVLDTVCRWRVPTLRLRAEDLMSGGTRRRAALRSTLDFAGVSARLDSDGRGWPEDMVVMASAPPAPGRWRARASLIGSAIAEPATRQLACELGYGPEPDARWI